jgi:hypothetical protein
MHRVAKISMEPGIAVSGENTETHRGLKKFERATMTRIGALLD